MRVTCPKCGFFADIDEMLLPPTGIDARCPDCQASFTVASAVVAPQAALSVDAFDCPKCGMRQPPGDVCTRCGLTLRKDTAPAAHLTGPADPNSASAEEVAPEEEEPGWVNFINIIAILFLVDSTLSLLKRVPGLADALGSGTAMSFHQRAKYLYDILMAAGFFVAVFGLFMRKNWARIAITVLLALGLAEGLYMIVYQYFAIAELETNLKENFSELRSNLNGKFVGCLIYAFFIFKLNTRNVRARFR
jgi:hypothetical protein